MMFGPRTHSYCSLIRSTMQLSKRSTWNHIISRSFGSEASNFKTLRLYRILLRTLSAFGDVPFLLRPTLSKHQTGMYITLEQGKQRDVLSLEDFIQPPKLPPTSSPKTPHPLQGLSIRVLGVSDNQIVSSEEMDIGKIFDDSSSDDNDSDSESSSQTKATDPLRFRPSVWVTKRMIAAAIQSLFRNPKQHQHTHQQHSLAISANSSLVRHFNLWKQTSTSNNHPRDIYVSAVAEPCTLNECARRFTYGYRVRIENRSQNTVQLLGRMWRIYPTLEKKNQTSCVQVDAPHGGAVGQFPILQPDQVFEYQSAAEASANGRMEGAMHFKDSNSGQEFEVPVPSFPLKA